MPLEEGTYLNELVGYGRDTIILNCVVRTNIDNDQIRLIWHDIRQSRIFHLTKNPSGMTFILVIVHGSCVVTADHVYLPSLESKLISEVFAEPIAVRGQIAIGD